MAYLLHDVTTPILSSISMLDTIQQHLHAWCDLSSISMSGVMCIMHIHSGCCSLHAVTFCAGILGMQSGPFLYADQLMDTLRAKAENK